MLIGRCLVAISCNICYIKYEKAKEEIKIMLNKKTKGDDIQWEV